MSFKLAKMGVGMTPPIQYKEITADEDVVLGEALYTSSGKLTKASGTNKPEYVAVGPKGTDGQAPVIKVEDYMEFETTLSAAPGSGESLAVGDKVTLHTDGMQVTATKTSGVAIINDLPATTVGTVVMVRF